MRARYRNINFNNFPQVETFFARRRHHRGICRKFRCNYISRASRAYVHRRFFSLFRRSKYDARHNTRHYIVCRASFNYITLHYRVDFRDTQLRLKLAPSKANGREARGKFVFSTLAALVARIIEGERVLG